MDDRRSRTSLEGVIRPSDQYHHQDQDGANKKPLTHGGTLYRGVRDYTGEPSESSPPNRRRRLEKSRIAACSCGRLKSGQ